MEPSENNYLYNIIIEGTNKKQVENIYNEIKKDINKKQKELSNIVLTG